MAVASCSLCILLPCMEKWPGLGCLCMGQARLSIGRGRKGRDPLAVWFFKQTFQWDCLLPFPLLCRNQTKGVWRTPTYFYLKPRWEIKLFLPNDYMNITYIVWKSSYLRHLKSTVSVNSLGSVAQCSTVSAESKGKDRVTESDWSGYLIKVTR